MKVGKVIAGGIDDVRSFAGKIAVGNENTMKTERTDQTGCGWTGHNFEDLYELPD